jgi:hypothetical protein
VRKKPHILYWTRSLKLLRDAGGNAEHAVASFDKSQMLAPADQLRGSKRAAVFNLLDKLPQEFLEIAIRHVDSCGGWDESGGPDLLVTLRVGSVCLAS